LRALTKTQWKAVWEKVTQNLSPIQAAIVTLLLHHNKTHLEVMRILNISKSTYYTHKTRIQEKLSYLLVDR
jgi:DNA-binding CsgD family transcriptional regulator